MKTSGLITTIRWCWGISGVLICFEGIAGFVESFHPFSSKLMSPEEWDHFLRDSVIMFFAGALMTYAAVCLRRHRRWASMVLRMFSLMGLGLMLYQGVMSIQSIASRAGHTGDNSLGMRMLESATIALQMTLFVWLFGMSFWKLNRAAALEACHR